MPKLTDSSGQIRRVSVLLIGGAVILANVVIVCRIALALGADINWDLLNYHFYNGYLWAHGRLVKDSICTVQSYLELTLNFFYYILISNYAPMTVNLVIAALQSLGISAAWLLCFRLLDGYNHRARFILSSVAAICAVIGPVFWSEIGGTMSDTLLATPVILALWLAMNGQTRERPIQLCLAGLLVGLAAGLKFTNMTYAVGIVVALVLTNLYQYKFDIRRIIVAGCIFGFSFILAFVVVYYDTGSLLWKAYGNPIFPYFNNLFHSPYIAFDPINDEHWFPRHPLGYLTLPFEFVIRNHTQTDPQHMIGMEIPFRTLFPAIFAVLIPFFFLAAHLRRYKTLISVDIFFVVSFLAGSFVIWELMFSNYRYFSVAETIFPSILIVLVVRGCGLTKLHRSQVILACAAVALVAIYSLPDTNFGRQPFSSSYFGVSKADFKPYNNALLIIGHAPLGFVLPYFPVDDRIIGLPERIPGLTMKFQDKYLKPLREYQKIYYLTAAADLRIHGKFLKSNYHIMIDYGKCVLYRTTAYTVAVCPAHREP